MRNSKQYRTKKEKVVRNVDVRHAVVDAVRLRSVGVGKLAEVKVLCEFHRYLFLGYFVLMRNRHHRHTCHLPHGQRI